MERKKIIILLKQREDIDRQLKQIVWKAYYGNEDMPDSFSWKKTIREQMGLVV